MRGTFTLTRSFRRWALPIHLCEVPQSETRVFLVPMGLMITVRFGLSSSRQMTCVHVCDLVGSPTSLSHSDARSKPKASFSGELDVTG